MDVTLQPIEIRVIGSLIEKQTTTPEYYPLTLNSLVNACNQTTNRDPVTTYDESAIARALEGLREKALVWVVRGGRALKYEHRLAEKLQLAGRELAVTCVLMLRGPQTPGEIRARTGRLHEFGSLEEVEAALETLANAQPPLAAKLPRSPGAKESRFAHRLGGDAPAEDRDSSPAAERESSPAAESGPVTDPNERERLARLEGEIETLRQELQELRGQLRDLKSQFE